MAAGRGCRASDGMDDSYIMLQAGQGSIQRTAGASLPSRKRLRRGGLLPSNRISQARETPSPRRNYRSAYIADALPPAAVPRRLTVAKCRPDAWREAAQQQLPAHMYSTSYRF